jgi:hypothetical protein
LANDRPRSESALAILGLSRVGAEGDVEMTAPPITDTGERREVLSRIASPNEPDAWIEGSPLVELTEV